jgi:hypothetical protein|tara:strand:+ start:36 stop:245 length:210 start_codon:yes stop_codon:yes gene_type:complete
MACVSLIPFSTKTIENDSDKNSASKYVFLIDSPNAINSGIYDISPLLEYSKIKILTINYFDIMKLKSMF